MPASFASGALRRLALAGLWLAICCASVAAQQRSLTLDDIYGGASGRLNFSGAPPAGLTWIDDAHYLWGRDDGGGLQWLKVDAVSGRSEPLFDVGRAVAGLAGLPASAGGRRTASCGVVVSRSARHATG